MLLTLLLLAAAPPSPASEIKKGHFAKALELVDRALAAKPRSKDAKRLQKLHDTLLPKVTVFEVFPEPEGATFTVDGVGATSPVTVDAGRHVFHFESPGFVPLDREETAVAGIRPKLTVVLERVPEPEVEPEAEGPSAAVLTPTAVASAPSEPVTAPVPEPAHYSITPYFLGGAGLVSALTGAALLFTAELQHIQSARYVAGIAAAGVGGALFLSAVLWLLVERRPGADLR